MPGAHFPQVGMGSCHSQDESVRRTCYGMKQNIAKRPDSYTPPKPSLSRWREKYQRLRRENRPIKTTAAFAAVVLELLSLKDS